MSETELNQRIKIEGAEESERRLTAMAAAAERLSRGFSAVASLGSTVGGIAGMWQVANAIADVDKLYQAVSRVKAITGMAAENAHAMFDMFELSGIGMGAAEGIMMNLARLSERMGGALSGSADQAQDLAQLMGKLGIAVKAGPEERLYQMADAAKVGKLRVQDLIKGFQIPRSQAAEMMEMLSQGSARLKAIKSDTLGSGDLITEAALRRHKEMLKIRRELADAWGGLVGTLYKNLIPAVTMVLTQIAAGMKAIEPIAERVGKVLAENMHLVVALAKVYLGLMLAAKAANLFAPGPAMGVLGRGRQLIGGANRAMAGRAAAAGTMDYFAARGANPGIGMFATVGGTWTRILGSVIGRFGVIGLVIGALAGAFELLRRNTLGIRDVFVSALGGILGHLKNIGSMLIGILGKLFEAVKPILGILGGALLIALFIVTKAIEAVAWVVEKVVMAIVGVLNGVIWAINKIPGVDVDMIEWNKASKSASDGVRGAGAGQGPTVYQDFRGSQFSIENNFPEGVDGGRVAVAVGDELAALGERRLGSGLSPLYSYRGG